MNWIFRYLKSVTCINNEYCEMSLDELLNIINICEKELFNIENVETFIIDMKSIYEIIDNNKQLRVYYKLWW